jgi:hypothetical protein
MKSIINIIDCFNIYCLSFLTFTAEDLQLLDVKAKIDHNLICHEILNLKPLRLKFDISYKNTLI